MIRLGDFCGYPAYTIEKGDICLTVTEYGATALSLRFRGREMILGFDTIEAYEDSGSCAGGVVGRFANRIGGAAFTLGGRRCALNVNDHANTLHGGCENGFWHKRRWTGEIEGEDAVSFTLFSPDGDNGFPGAMTAKALYRVSDSSVRMEFSGVSDADTLYAPTSHIYFSLGEDNILGVQMQINASGHLEVDRELIPTGNVLPATDYPALQLYTGEFLDGGYAPNAGFAIEPEQYPDAPNKPHFPSAVLKAGEQFSKYLEFSFEA